MELRHLRYFVTTAECLHFGRAAQQLRIAQPSLSQQILQLESELRTKLFERDKKRVRLTEAGVLFLQETRQILQDVDRAALIARAGRDQVTERLRVGFGAWTDVTKVCEAVKHFDDSHPDVHIELYTMNVPNQIAALQEGRIDIAFVRPRVTDPALESEFLFSEAFVVAMPKNHRLAGQKRVTLSALKEERIIMPVRESLPYLHDLTLELFHDAGFVPNVGNKVDYATMLLGLVASGMGISLVPASIRKIQSGGIVFVPLQESSRIIETAVAWRRNNVPATLGDFLQAVRDVVSAPRRPRRGMSSI